MDERNFRAIARERLRGSWAVSIGVAAVACLLGGLLTGSSFLPKVESELGMAVPFLTEFFEELSEEI